MSGRAIAAELGITDRTVSDYMTRRRMPTSRTMDRLNAFLAKREVVDAVRSEKEAHLLFLYRELPPEDQSTAENVLSALYTKSTAAPQPPPQQI